MLGSGAGTVAQCRVCATIEYGLRVGVAAVGPKENRDQVEARAGGGGERQPAWPRQTRGLLLCQQTSRVEPRERIPSL